MRRWTRASLPANAEVHATVVEIASASSKIRRSPLKLRLKWIKRTKTKHSLAAVKTFQNHRPAETLRSHRATTGRGRVHSTPKISAASKTFAAKWRRSARDPNAAHHRWTVNARCRLPATTNDTPFHIPPHHMQTVPIRITFTSDETLAVSNCPIRRVTLAIKSCRSTR